MPDKYDQLIVQYAQIAEMLSDEEPDVESLENAIHNFRLDLIKGHSELTLKELQRLEILDTYGTTVGRKFALRKLRRKLDEEDEKFDKKYRRQSLSNKSKGDLNWERHDKGYTKCKTRFGYDILVTDAEYKHNDLDTSVFVGLWDEETVCSVGQLVDVRGMHCYLFTRDGKFSGEQNGGASCEGGIMSAPTPEIVKRYQSAMADLMVVKPELAVSLAQRIVLLGRAQHLPNVHGAHMSLYDD